MTLTIRPPNQADVLLIARAMREWDRREIYALRWTDNPLDIVTDVMGCGSFAWVAALDEPIAAIGAAPVCPGVWSVWMFATDAFPAIGFSLTRFVRRVMIPALVASGAHRAETMSMEGHTDAQRWLEHLGAKHEATLRQRGRNGQNFLVYAWVK